MTDGKSKPYSYWNDPFWLNKSPREKTFCVGLIGAFGLVAGLTLGFGMGADIERKNATAKLSKTPPALSAPALSKP